MEKYSVDRSQSGIPLVDFIAAVLSCSKKQAKKLVDSKRVYVNRQRIWIASHRLNSGDQVELPPIPASGTAVTKQTPTVQILWREDPFLVLNKPAGVLSNEEKSLEEAARKELSAPELLAVHRLDKDTSGCLIFALNQASFDVMKGEFEEHRVKKVYLALVAGQPTFTERSVRTPLDGKEAISHFRLREKFGTASLLEVEIETGRTHQIRRHLQELRLPVIGDTQYSAKVQNDAEFRSVARQMLHAHQVRFVHPNSKKPVTVTAPMPKDFKDLAAKLRKG